MYRIIDMIRGRFGDLSVNLFPFRLMPEYVSIDQQNMIMATYVLVVYYTVFMTNIISFIIKCSGLADRNKREEPTCEQYTIAKVIHLFSVISIIYHITFFLFFIRFFEWNAREVTFMFFAFIFTYFHCVNAYLHKSALPRSCWNLSLAVNYNRIMDISNLFVLLFNYLVYVFIDHGVSTDYTVMFYFGMLPIFILYMTSFGNLLSIILQMNDNLEISNNEKRFN